MSSSHNKLRRLTALPVIAVVIVFGGAGLLHWAGLLPSSAPPAPSAEKEITPGSQVADSESTAQTSQQSPPAAKVLAGAFAQYDTLPDGYVGTAACASCHADRHRSYLRTDHSRSLREVDLSLEPHDQTLRHALSKRSYDVLARDGQLWHREWKHFSGAPNDRLRINELPVRYVMGSGAFAKGYLLADGDYLLQSPVTWYAGSGGYDMAPGYDEPQHLGFTRTIDDECLFCHAGLLSRRNENPHQPAIHELSIGCERCHGPGQEHSQLYRKIASGTLPAPDENFDARIVHPNKLDRRETESVCAQCHMHGDLIIHSSAGQVLDFVAGDDFSHTRMLYKHDQPGEFSDAFTGHFDQMWQSKCYLQSETLTCITCHDPHPSDDRIDPIQLRNQQCNQCHEQQGCGVPLQQRMELQDNHCVACHMPAVQSEIPHTSTTSHLIAVYQSGKPRGVTEPSPQALRRLQASPNMTDEQIARLDLLADAYWAVERARGDGRMPGESSDIENRLPQLICGDRGDAEIYSLLSRFSRARAELTPETEENQASLDRLWDAAANNATKALQRENRPVLAREAALEVLGNQRMRGEDYAGALACFAELTRIRRSAVDWYNLGLCLARTGRLADAEKALGEAIRLDASYAAPYRSLSIFYRSTDPARAQWMGEAASRLLQP